MSNKIPSPPPMTHKILKNNTIEHIMSFVKNTNDNDRYKRFIERIYDILITGNIDDLNCKEQFKILQGK